ncbi:AAA family ATPase [Candidatus Pelagibacter communis]|uniref:AAA family ATPase n=1 Tax=Pelagibacter ubique TaxID=198252 RepID=UPI00094D5FA9|nr:AAA family ATPase [Candidatus Pelagibacter ubique]
MTPVKQTKLLTFKNYFQELVDLSLKNNLPNKLLFSGNKGIGKSTFAYHLINYFFSIDEDDSYNLKNNEININNKSYKLVLNNAHPNLLLIDSQDKKFIEISKIRDILNFSSKTSFSSKKKIILIDNVEKLNINASNSLLKILEEPSTNLFFILIHSSPEKIMSTISSRCIKFNFFLTESEKELIINNVLDNNFYNNLSNDFKIKYMTPKFYIDLQNFINKEKIDLNDLNINFLLNHIFNKRNYLKNDFIIGNLQILIEIYFYNKILKRNNFENDYKFFKQTINKINDMNKFNLDKDSSLLEIKNIIVNER